MSILNIRPVKGGQSKVILALAGQSGSGKTLTALYIARGMVDSADQIGFLDTENQRGSLYHNVLDGKFQIADLFAPFSPKRYAQAVKEFQDAGIKVLVIDSISHETEGIGGIDDIANSPKADGTPRKIADWRTAKSEHKVFMNALLYAGINVICCIRAREKTDFKNPNMPVSLGIQPICEKNFLFEMTASLMMQESGKKQQHIKVPNFLQSVFGNGSDYIGIKTGEKLREYFNTVEKDTEEIQKLKSQFLSVSEQGVDALLVLWNTLTSTNKTALKEFVGVCKESAIAYDKMKEDAANESDVHSVEDIAKAKQRERIIEHISKSKTADDLKKCETAIPEDDAELFVMYDAKLSQLKSI